MDYICVAFLVVKDTAQLETPLETPVRNCRCLLTSLSTKHLEIVG